MDWAQDIANEMVPTPCGVSFTQARHSGWMQASPSLLGQKKMGLRADGWLWGLGQKPHVI